MVVFAVIMVMVALRIAQHHEREDQHRLIQHPTKSRYDKSI
jgi:hypothetical protein